MRSATTRHVTSLRLTLVGTLPGVRRDVVVDRDLTVAELGRVVQSLFDWPSCRHHLFTNSLAETGWSRERRRWGDRWTMIDFRDPTVIDEETARLGHVLRNNTPLYFAHSCDTGWVVEIETGPDDVVAASNPPVRIVGGERRSPFACSRGMYEHDVLVSVLGDASHPDHEALRLRIESTVGPWATFDAQAFDLDAAQRTLDAPPAHARESRWTQGPLEGLVRRLPEPARAGLRTHLAAAGLELPVVVTADETARMTRDFRWLIAHASDDGISLIDGAIDPAAVRAGAEALGCDEDRVQHLFAVARQLRLVYLRHGRLVAKKSVRAAAESPTDLWAILADALSSSTAGGVVPAARDLFLLAIADGSLDDSSIGIARAAHAFALTDGWRRDFRYRSWGDEIFQDHDCDQHCDCPDISGATWHDIVAKSIRDAAASAASDGALTVAAGGDYRDARTAGVLPEWVEERTPRARIIDTRPGDNAGNRLSAESEMVRAVGSIIDTLLLFGLSRSDDGAWSVPPTLREFAKAALRPRRGSAVF